MRVLLWIGGGAATALSIAGLLQALSQGRMPPLWVDPLLRANQLRLSRDTEGAIREYRLHLSQLPMDSRARFGLATALADAHRWADVIAVLEETLTLQRGERGPVHYHLALAHFMMSREQGSPEERQTRESRGRHHLAMAEREGFPVPQGFYSTFGIDREPAALKEISSREDQGH